MRRSREKYFLLKNRENVWYNMAAVLLLFDISARPEVRKCFEEKYHYKRKDIFDEYLDVGLGAEYMKAKRLSREVNELKEILKKKKTLMRRTENEWTKGSGRYGS